jgi:subtilisin family serine protease
LGLGLQSLKRIRGNGEDRRYTMKKLSILARASLLVLPFALQCFAQGDSYIVRVQPSAIESVARQYKLKVTSQLRSEGVYLVKLPRGASPEAILRDLQANAAVQAIEKNGVAKLPEISGNANAGKRRIPHVPGGVITVPMPGNPFSAYTNQKPNSIIRLQQAQKQAGYGNGITVAMIDTWVDRRHAVLASSSVLPVKYFKNGQPYDTSTTQETTPFVDQETTPFVDQETTPFVDGLGSVVVVQQETTPFVDQETTPFVDQETTPFVDQETTPFVDSGIAWAHGTMVAGIIHLVVPNATIMPLRAFDGTGEGSMADVIAAIQWATDKNVHVINMSFSASEASQALKDAIAAAQAKGIICIASVTNENSAQSSFPAALPNVTAVAATNNNSERAAFSNFGPEVDISAPGVDIWTTYPTKRSAISPNPNPNTRYAAGSGTSFSTAYVSGAAALLKSANPGLTIAEVLAQLQAGAEKTKSPELNGGELDVFLSLK